MQSYDVVMYLLSCKDIFTATAVFLAKRIRSPATKKIEAHLRLTIIRMNRGCHTNQSHSNEQSKGNPCHGLGCSLLYSEMAEMQANTNYYHRE